MSWFPLFHHHVFHPRDLHFPKNSQKRRKYCFSLSLNSLFRCFRSFVESWCSQYIVILNVWDMIKEDISGRVSGLSGRRILTIVQQPAARTVSLQPGCARESCTRIRPPCNPVFIREQVQTIRSVFFSVLPWTAGRAGTGRHRYSHPQAG